jgi:hypothetical protein
MAPTNGKEASGDATNPHDDGEEVPPAPPPPKGYAPITPAAGIAAPDAVEPATQAPPSTYRAPMGTKPLPPRAELRLEGHSALDPQTCLKLAVSVSQDTTGGANYAGQGLSFHAERDADAPGWVFFTMLTRRGEELASFTAEAASTASGWTYLRVGGLDSAKVLKHTVMLVPVGNEIAGFGFYKKYLRNLEGSLLQADPSAQCAIAGEPRLP